MACGCTWEAVEHLCQPPHVVAVVIHIYDVGLVHVSRVVCAPPDSLSQVPGAAVGCYSNGRSLLNMLHLPGIWQKGNAIHWIDLYVLRSNQSTLSKRALPGAPFIPLVMLGFWCCNLGRHPAFVTATHFLVLPVCGCMGLMIEVMAPLK